MDRGVGQILASFSMPKYDSFNQVLLFCLRELNPGLKFVVFSEIRVLKSARK